MESFLEHNRVLHSLSKGTAHLLHDGGYTKLSGRLSGGQQTYVFTDKGLRSIRSIAKWLGLERHLTLKTA